MKYSIEEHQTENFNSLIKKVRLAVDITKTASVEEATNILYDRGLLSIEQYNEITERIKKRNITLSLFDGDLLNI